MSRITAKLVNHSWDVSGAGNTAGVPEYSYREVYRVPWGLYDDGTENPYARRSDSPTFVYEAIDPDYQSGVDPPEEEWLVGGLPRLYESKVLPESYQPPGQDPPPAIPDIPAEDQRTYYVVSYSAQLFTDPSASATYWEFTYEYDANFGLFKNDGTPIEDDPTELALQVDVEFDQEWKMIDDAYFQGVAVGPPDDVTRGFVPSLAAAPEWMKATTAGQPICNTAKQLRDVNRPKAYAIISATRVVDSVTEFATTWADQLWTVNDDAFLIHDGSKGSFNHLFPARSLLLQRMNVVNWFWHKQKKYFQIRFEFRVGGYEGRYQLREYAHYHFEPDRGNACYCYHDPGTPANSNFGPMGQNGDGGQYTQADITRLVKQSGTTSPTTVVSEVTAPLVINIVDANGQPAVATPSGEFRLNGAGQPSGWERKASDPDNGEEWFTAWKIYKESDFDFGFDQVSP